RAHPALRSLPTRRSSDLSHVSPPSVGFPPSTLRGLGRPRAVGRRLHEEYEDEADEHEGHDAERAPDRRAEDRDRTRPEPAGERRDRKSTRLNSSHVKISY